MYITLPNPLCCSNGAGAHSADDDYDLLLLKLLKYQITVYDLVPSRKFVFIFESSNLNHSPNELENAENITKNFERFLKKHLEKKNREVLDAQFPVLKIAVVVLSIVAAMVTYHSMKIAKDFDRKFEELQNEHTVMRTKIEVDRENMKNSVQSGDDKLMKVIESQNEKILKLSGWFKASNNLFYKRFSEKVDYLTARKRCKQLGAQLISTGFRDPDVRR
ncbi:uncharacterized protein LOC120343166 [Styela clava]